MIATKTNVIARLVPDHATKRFDIEIVEGVSAAELAAAAEEGTASGGLRCPGRRDGRWVAPALRQATSFDALRGRQVGCAAGRTTTSSRARMMSFRSACTASAGSIRRPAHVITAHRMRLIYAARSASLICYASASTAGRRTATSRVARSSRDTTRISRFVSAAGRLAPSFQPATVAGLWTLLGPAWRRGCRDPAAYDPHGWTLGRLEYEA